MAKVMVMTKLKRPSITGSCTNKGPSTLTEFDDPDSSDNDDLPLIMPSDHPNDEEEDHTEDDDTCENNNRKPLSWRIKTRGSKSSSSIRSPSQLTRKASSRTMTSEKKKAASKSRKSQFMASFQKVTSSCSSSSNTTATTQSGAAKSSKKQSSVFKKASGFLASRRSSLGKQRSDRTDASSEPPPGGAWNELVDDDDDEYDWDEDLIDKGTSLLHLRNNALQFTDTCANPSVVSLLRAETIVESSTFRTLTKSSPPSIRNKKSQRGGQTQRCNRRLDRKTPTSQKRSSGGGTSSNRHRSRSPRLLEHFEGRTTTRRRSSVGDGSTLPGLQPQRGSLNTTNAPRRGLRRSTSCCMRI